MVPQFKNNAYNNKIIWKVQDFWQGFDYCGNLPENVHCKCQIVIGGYYYISQIISPHIFNTRGIKDTHKYNQVSTLQWILDKMDYAFIHNYSFTDLFMYQ